MLWDPGRRFGVAPGCLAAGGVTARPMTTTAAGEQDDDNQQDYEENEGSKHLDPAWCAGVVAGVGRGGRVSHARALSARVVVKGIVTANILQYSMSLVNT